MTAEALLDLIEEKGVLPDTHTSYLRRQLAQAAEPIRPVVLARRLVSKGMLNQYHAKSLLEEGSRRFGGVKYPRPAQGEDEYGQAPEELDLAPLDKMPYTPRGSKPSVAKTPENASPAPAAPPAAQVSSAGQTTSGTREIAATEVDSTTLGLGGPSDSRGEDGEDLQPVVSEGRLHASPLMTGEDEPGRFQIESPAKFVMFLVALFLAALAIVAAVIWMI